MGEYPGVQDSWMDDISSQGTSLLSVDLSGSDVTDTGLGLLKAMLLGLFIFPEVPVSDIRV